MIVELNKGVSRHFKVNGRYGEAIPQDNGFGQGDPFALLIALVYWHPDDSGPTSHALCCHYLSS